MLRVIFFTVALLVLGFEVRVTLTLAFVSLVAAFLGADSDFVSVGLAATRDVEATGFLLLATTAEVPVFFETTFGLAGGDALAILSLVGLEEEGFLAVGMIVGEK